MEAEGMKDRIVRFFRLVQFFLRMKCPYSGEKQNQTKLFPPPRYLHILEHTYLPELPYPILAYPQHLITHPQPPFPPQSPPLAASDTPHTPSTSPTPCSTSSSSNCTVSAGEAIQAVVHASLALKSFAPADRNWSPTCNVLLPSMPPR